MKEKKNVIFEFLLFISIYKNNHSIFEINKKNNLHSINNDMKIHFLSSFHACSI